jgi:hypothetical protein
MNTKQLWQAQALDAPRISLAFVRLQSDALRRRTRRLNAFNYIGGTTGMAYLAWRGAEFFSSEPLMFAATVLWVAAGLIGLLLQRKRLASEEQPAELGVLDALKFHRRQLERQRFPRSGSWRWLPLLFLPGHVMLFLSFFFEISPIPWKAIILNAVVIVFGTLLAIVMTERSARRIQKEIDDLDSLRGSRA